MAFIGILISMLMLAVIFIIIVIACIMVVIGYILESMFLYKFSKKAGCLHPLTAWIPFYNKCILGQAADRKIHGIFLSVVECMKMLCYVVLVMYINQIYIFTGASVYYITAMFPTVLTIASFVLNIYLVYRILKKAMPDKADAFTLLNIFTVGISCPIILFLIRNNDKLIITPNQREMMQL